MELKLKDSEFNIEYLNILSKTTTASTKTTSLIRGKINAYDTFLK